MSKAGTRLLNAAREMRAIARGEAKPARSLVSAAPIGIEADLAEANLRKNVLGEQLLAVEADLVSASQDRDRYREIAEQRGDALLRDNLDRWPIGTLVEKIKGAFWRGKICGYYSTSLTPEGYCVESDYEPGSVQLYPRASLAESSPKTQKDSAQP